MTKPLHELTFEYMKAQERYIDMLAVELAMSLKIAEGYGWRSSNRKTLLQQRDHIKQLHAELKAHLEANIAPSTT
jgi:hypothetical protein